MARHKHPKVVIKKLGRNQAWGQYWEHNNTIEIDDRAKGKAILVVKK
jgi:hypothetical protein